MHPPQAHLERALDLAIEHGDLAAAKERLHTLKGERQRVAAELAQARVSIPDVEELMPRLREKLRDLEASLKADVPCGRLVLGGLFGVRKLRVYRDGRIEGTATLEPEALAAPRRTQEPRDRVVARAG